MSLQLRRTADQLGAHRAHTRRFTRALARMAFLCSLVREDSAAYVTAVGRLSSVLSHVCLQLVRAGKRFGAKVAHVEPVVHSLVLLARSQT